MSIPRVLILRAPGTNCDIETAFAFETAGARVNLAHVRSLIDDPHILLEHEILAIPGGFTYGDDISAGVILANELRLKLPEDLQKFIEAGRLILGICNGLQILVKAGILPGPFGESDRRLSIVVNESGKFECRWTYLQVNQSSPCIFTKGIESLYLPVAHAEGRVVASPELLERLNVVLQYSDEAGNTAAGYPHNPNGSMLNIAGICDDSGRIFALMPHPERHVLGTQHPRWTREGLKLHGDGLHVFVNAINWVRAI